MFVSRVVPIAVAPLIAAAATPFINSVIPPSAAPGSDTRMIAIRGANLASGATVISGSVTLSPASVPPALISVLRAAELTSPRTASILVNNPPLSPARVSNAVAFPIAPSALTLAAAPTRLTVNQPCSITTGDFNGDGHADIAVAAPCATLTAVASGLVSLNSLIAPESEWSASGAFAINNSGQILAFGSGAGRTTTLLLTPSLPGSRAPTQSASALRPLKVREGLRSSCAALTFTATPSAAPSPFPVGNLK
jgi:hypothetical protein